MTGRGVENSLAYFWTASKVTIRLFVLKNLQKKKPDKAALTLNVSSAVGTSASSTSHGSSSTLTPTPLESPKSPVVVGGIEFAGTAEEARRKMSKKRGAKSSNMSAKAKYDLFQKL